MPQGTLALKVINVDHVPSEVEGEQLHVIVEIAGEKKTAKGNELVNLDLKDVNGSNEVSFQVGVQRKRKFNVVASGATTLSAVQNNVSNVTLSDGVQLIVDGKWTIKNTTQKYAGPNTAQTADTIKETGASIATLNPERAMAVHEPHRPKYLRALFYYDTTKNVYNYSTSFRLIASVARFSEHSANAVLQKVTGKNLHEIDDNVVVPVLSSLDDKVDATISAVLIKLVEGQNYVLQKKNDAVETASTVVDSTWKTVTHAKDVTTSSIYSVSSSAYEKACDVTDYTTSQVVNVSSSTLGTVRNAGVYVVSHVPYLGAKIRT